MPLQKFFSVLELELYFIKLSYFWNITKTRHSSLKMENPKERNEENETNSWLDTYLTDSLLSSWIKIFIFYFYLFIKYSYSVVISVQQSRWNNKYCRLDFSSMSSTSAFFVNFEKLKGKIVKKCDGLKWSVTGGTCPKREYRLFWTRVASPPPTPSRRAQRSWSIRNWNYRLVTFFLLFFVVFFSVFSTSFLKK